MRDFTHQSSTPHQRLCLRTLLRKAELDTDRFTHQHRVPFKAAGLPEPTAGDPVDTHLRAISKADASALISALRRQLGTEE